MERLVQAAELRNTGLIAGAVLRTALARGESTLDRMHSPRGQRAKPGAGPALTTPVWRSAALPGGGAHAHQALPAAARGAVGLRPGLIARRFGCDAATLGNALDQVLGDLVFLTLHAATPEMAERASVIARVSRFFGGCRAAGGAGWVVYARLDLGSGDRTAAEAAPGGR